MERDHFDPDVTLNLLQTISLSDYSGQLSYRGPSDDHPLEALHALVDFYLEVHEGADVFGKCMAAGVSKFLDPTIRPPTATLSDTEHIRITCTLWVVKIFHQLQSRLTKSMYAYTMPFVDALKENLLPWQIDQFVSLATKLQAGEYPHHLSLVYAGPTDPALSNRLMETTYVKNLVLSCCRPLRQLAHLQPLIRAVSSFRHRDSSHTTAQVSPPPEASPTTTRLRNHISIAVSLAQHNTPAAFAKRYAALCRYLGLFFWDLDRLEQWHIADPSELITASDVAYLRGLSFDFSHDTSTLRLEKRLNANERTMERQVIEWTRCADGLTLEDWLHQKTVASRSEQGEEAFPRKFIVPGLVCSNCGLDGHWKGRCRPSMWRHEFDYDFLDYSSAESD